MCHMTYICHMTHICVVYIYMSQFFIHSSTNGCLNCVQVLIVVNNSSANGGCRYLLKLVFPFPLAMSPEVELQDHMGFPGGSEGEESVCKAGDLASSPGSGKSPREGNGYPLQYSCL